MKRFLLASSAMLLCTLSVGLFAPYSASAASDYDDAYYHTDVLTLFDSATSETVDVTNSIGLLLSGTPIDGITDYRYRYNTNDMCPILNEPCLPVQQILDNFSTAGSWSISTKPDENKIIIGFVQDDILLLDWLLDPYSSEPYIAISPLNSDIQYIVFQFSGNPGMLEVFVGNGLNYPRAVPLISSSTGYMQNFLVNSSFYNYPPGYDGPIIPDTFEPVDTTPPEFQFTYAVADKQITLYDLSNLSLDQTACYFQINPNGTQVNTELHYDCDTQNSVTHTVDEYGLYDITLMYVTPDGLKSSIILTLDIDGSSFSDTYGYAVNDIFYKCISSELPFINFTECYNNVLIFANMLAFDRLHFGTDFTPPEGCRNLVVLGDWIGASTNTVCPMIPSYVRDVTTPFVTFLLGLLMLKFITSRAGGGFS